LQVPFCLNIRQKLQEQKQSQRRRADMLMMRRMNQLNQPPSAIAGPPPTTPGAIFPQQPGSAAMSGHMPQHPSTSNMNQMPMHQSQQLQPGLNRPMPAAVRKFFLLHNVSSNEDFQIFIFQNLKWITDHI
jgi:hypothetical protein